MNLIKLIWATLFSTIGWLLAFRLLDHAYFWVLTNLIFLPASGWTVFCLLIISCFSWLLARKLIPYLDKCARTPIKFWGIPQGVGFGFFIGTTVFILLKPDDLYKSVLILAISSGFLSATLQHLFVNPAPKNDKRVRHLFDEYIIQNSSEDKLAIELTVNEIVSAIGQPWVNGGSIVSVYGTNGIGKSCAIQLAINRLDAEYPDIAHKFFEPYHFASEAEMVRNFFDAVMSHLDDNYAFPGVSSVSRKLTALAYGLSSQGPVSIQIGRLLDIFVPQDDFKSIQTRVEGYLDALNQRILIVVDDIDRCSPRKRHLFFQMVNSIKGFERVRILISGSTAELLTNQPVTPISVLD